LSSKIANKLDNLVHPFKSIMSTIKIQLNKILPSISSTFYIQIFRTNVVFGSFSLVTFWLWGEIRTKNWRVKHWWNWHLVKLSNFKEKMVAPHLRHQIWCFPEDKLPDWGFPRRSLIQWWLELDCNCHSPEESPDRRARPGKINKQYEFILSGLTSLFRAHSNNTWHSRAVVPNGVPPNMELTTFFSSFTTKLAKGAPNCHFSQARVLPNNFQTYRVPRTKKGWKTLL